MSSIGSLSSNSNPYINTDSQKTTSTGKTGDVSDVSSGTSGISGPAPSATSGSTGQASAVMTAMFESLHAFMPSVDEQDQDVLLAEVQLKLKNTVTKTDTDEINNKTARRNNELEEQKKKLDDAEKKLEETIKLQNSGDIADKIKLAFEMLGIALMIALAAVAAPFSGGASMAAVVAGVALIVTIAASSVLAINDLVKESTPDHLGIAGSIDKLVHPNDPSSWSKADEGFAYAFMGVAILGAIFSGGAGMAGEAETLGEAFANIGSSIKDFFADAAETVSNMASKVSNFVTGGGSEVSSLETLADTGTSLGGGAASSTQTSEEIAASANDAADAVSKANNIKTGLQAGNAVNTVATASTDIASGAINYQATEMQAENKQDNADAKKLEAMTKALDKMIEFAIQRLAADGNRWVKMLEAVTDAMKDHADTVGRAKLTA